MVCWGCFLPSQEPMWRQAVDRTLLYTLQLVVEARTLWTSCWTSEQTGGVGTPRGKLRLTFHRPTAAWDLCYRKEVQLSRFPFHVTVTPDGKMTHPLCPRLPRSLLPVAALPLLYSPVSRSESPPQSLQPLPSSQHQGFPAVPVTVASLQHPAWGHATRAELDRCFQAGSVVLSQHY